MLMWIRIYSGLCKIIKIYFIMIEIDFEGKTISDFQSVYHLRIV